MTHRIRLRSVARVWIAAAAVATGTTLGMAAPALAQADLAARGAALARRVADIRDGTVRLTFALRPDVCGSGNSIRTNGDRGRISWSDGPNRTRDVEWDDDCESGPGRLALDVRGGAVQAVRFYVGGRWRAADRVTDLGQVPAAQAAGMLLALAERGEGKAARDAIFPTTVIDSVTVWPGLLKIARDDRAEKGVRSQAVFWLGQAAGDAAAQGLAELHRRPGARGARPGRLRPLAPRRERRRARAHPRRAHAPRPADAPQRDVLVRPLERPTRHRAVRGAAHEAVSA